MKICESFKNKEVLRGTTRAGILIYLFSELNEKGLIIKLIGCKEINEECGLSRASYYRGIKELTEKKLILENNTNKLQNKNNQNKIIIEITQDKDCQKIIKYKVGYDNNSKLI